MRPLDFSLFVVMSVLLVNYVMMRMTTLYQRRELFLSVETFNVVSAAFIAWKGLPGFESWPAAKYLIAIAMAFRAVWNWHLRNEWLASVRLAERIEERDRVLAALRDSSDEPDDEPG